MRSRQSRCTSLPSSSADASRSSSCRKPSGNGKGGILLALTSCKKEDAPKLSRLLLEEKLAACVSAIPAKSAYRWKGKLERAKEAILVIKTAPELKAKLERFLKGNHPYELPEIVFLQADSSEEYGRWLKESLIQQ